MAATIRDLNDAFRRSFSGGRVVCTAAVMALAPDKLGALLARVRSFDGFGADNDPHGEHDFGALDFDGRRYFWKIDYYDRALEFGSENPADPEVTTRVLTIMRAEDY